MTAIVEREDLRLPSDVGRSTKVAGALLAGALLGWIISLFTIDINDVNSLGFASAFTPVTWASLLLASGAVVVAVFRVPLDGPWFWRLVITGLVLLVTIIHGTPMVLESAPRFFEAYQHVGFIEYISRTGQHSAAVNYRLSWFGAFGLGATLSGTAGSPELFGAIRVFPWAFGLLILLPVYSIVSKFIVDQRTRAATLVVFVIGNWIAQDYLSPQALAYFLSMTMVALVVNLAPGEGTSIRSPKRWWALRSGPRVVLVTLTAFYSAIVLAHQLSPIMVFALVLVLVLTGTTTLRVFPLVIFAAFATWVSVGGYYFWGGEISRLLGIHQESGQSLGLSAIIAQNLTGRLQHGGLEQVVAVSRVGLSLIILALAATSAIRGRKEGNIRVLALLAFIPFLLLGTTGYGGEALLRGFFFALPFTSALVAILVTKIRPRMLAMVLLSIVVGCLGACTEISRYGNEKFEQISADQLAIMQDLYRVVPPDLTIIGFGTAMPVNFTKIGADAHYFMNFFKFSTAGPSGPQAEQEIKNQIDTISPDVAVWTPEAAAFTTHTFHFTAGWDQPILKYLLKERHGHLILNRPDIKIINFDKSWHPSAGAFSTNGG